MNTKTTPVIQSQHCTDEKMNLALALSLQTYF